MGCWLFGVSLFLNVRLVRTLYTRKRRLEGGRRMVAILVEA